MNKRVLLFTDSLALPRETPEICSYEDTWPILLKNNCLEIHQVSIGGATSTDLLRQVNYHRAFQPDVVIIQVGIVDCAPRFMSKLEMEIAKRIPYLGKAIIKGMNNTFIKKNRNINYVNPRLFKKNIDDISLLFRNVEIYFIGIIPPNPAYDKILPGITKRITEYNNILKQKTNLIETEGFNLDGVMSDFHHLNKIGHKEMYERVMNRINA